MVLQAIAYTSGIAKNKGDYIMKKINKFKY